MFEWYSTSSLVDIDLINHQRIIDHQKRQQKLMTTNLLLILCPILVFKMKMISGFMH